MLNQNEIRLIPFHRQSLWSSSSKKECRKYQESREIRHLDKWRDDHRSRCPTKTNDRISWRNQNKSVQDKPTGDKIDLWRP